MAEYLKHIEVLGTPVACASYESGIQAIRILAGENRSSAVCAGNTHIVSLARHDPSFGKVMRGFDLILPDGMPLIWNMNAGGAGLKDRVYGPYFMREALRQLARPWKHFFFGGSESCLRELSEAALKLQPDLDLVGTYSPPFRPWTEADEEQFARIIREKKPDFIWVALGGERQERWISRNLHRYERGVFLAVGDAFELLAGRRPFAPDWMQRFGLTWLYRLFQEPRRLWMRYLRYNSLFLSYFFLDLFRPRASLPAHEMGLEYKKIGPITFLDISEDELVARVLGHSSEPKLFTALNAFSLSLAMGNEKLCRLLNESCACFCDGFGVHVAHLFFEWDTVVHRSTPTDWIHDLIAACSREKRKVFLLGDRQRVVEAFYRKMDAQYPGVICGYHNGFFEVGSAAEDEIIDRINGSGAEVLLVGMGMPKQELWSEDNKGRLKVSSILMVGASLAFLTGFRKRGPKWATDRGLEWLFRILYEPITMGPRYFIGLPKLFFQLMWYYMRKKH